MVKLKRRKKDQYNWKDEFINWHSRSTNIKLRKVKSYVYEYEFELSITHNGYQWSTIRFNKEEGFEIRKLMDKHFRLDIWKKEG